MSNAIVCIYIHSHTHKLVMTLFNFIFSDEQYCYIPPLCVCVCVLYCIYFPGVNYMTKCLLQTNFNLVNKVWSSRVAVWLLLSDSLGYLTQISCVYTCLLPCVIERGSTRYFLKMGYCLVLQQNWHFKILFSVTMMHYHWTVN